jgi:hypothetical protein
MDDHSSGTISSARPSVVLACVDQTQTKLVERISTTLVKRDEVIATLTQEHVRLNNPVI